MSELVRVAERESALTPLGTEMVFSCSKFSPSFSTVISRTPSPCRGSSGWASFSPVPGSHSPSRIAAISKAHSPPRRYLL